MANQKVVEDYMNAARGGDVDKLYSLIEQHPHVLDEIDKTPFPETPLHVAASVGNASFALELMILKPSYGRKLNKSGLTPLHLALQERRRAELSLQEQCNRDLVVQQTPQNEDGDLQGKLRKVVLRLVEVDKDLVRVKGRGGVTPLHFVAQTGDLDLLLEFLNVCPESILETTNRNESPLHIALKHKQFRAFQLLKEWLYQAPVAKAIFSRSEFLNSKDEDGKTVSDIEKENRPYQSGTQLSNREIKQMLSSESTLRRSTHRRIKEETRNALLIVAGLLITLTFQTVLTPPGGTWSDDYLCPANDTSRCAGKPSHRAGTAVMGRGPFLILIVFSFLSSSSLLFLVLPLFPRDNYNVGWIAPLCGLIACFMLSVFVTYPSSEGLSAKYFYSVLMVLLAMIICYLYLFIRRPNCARALEKLHKFFNH